MHLARVHFLFKILLLCSVMTRTQYKKIIILVGLALLLLSFVILTNPKNLALPLLIVPFLLTFLFVYKLVQFTLPNKSLLHSRRTRTILAGSIALVPVLLLMFQSIHQLTIRDVFVVVSLAGLTAFYVAKADFIQ